MKDELDKKINKKQVESLTDEQKAKFPHYVDKWIRIGLNTDRFTEDEATAIIHPLQEHILKTKTTPVLVFDNPVEAWIAFNYSVQGVKPEDIRSKVDQYFDGKSKIDLVDFIYPYLDGAIGSNNFAFYDYFISENIVEFDAELLKRYKIWEATSKLGLIFPNKDEVVIVSQKPIRYNNYKVVRDGNVRMIKHSETEESIVYAGRGVVCKKYHLNDVEVPDWLALTPSSKLTIEDYNRLNSADQRMEFVRKFGIERMLSYGKKVDSYDSNDPELWRSSEYELWDMSVLFPNINYAPHLKMLNQTTGVWHVEAVSPSCRKIEDALRERFGGDMEIVAIA